VVQFEKSAERLSPGLALWASEQLQSGERELSLRDREPPLADQPRSEPGRCGGKPLRGTYCEHQHDA
jgi:hypothetical protein